MSGAGTAVHVAWLNGLPPLQQGLALCGFFLTIARVGIPVIQPHILTAVHGRRTVNDIVIFAAANCGLVYAVLRGILGIVIPVQLGPI